MSAAAKFRDHLLRDLSFAIRTLRKQRGFSFTAITTLALGIGAATAIFSVVNGVLLRPLPFADPQRLVLIRERLPKLLPKPITIPALDVTIFARESTSFESVAGFIPKEFDLTGSGAPRRIAAARVEWNLFPLLGVQPLIGRVFDADEDHPDSYLAVVSYGFWKDHLGGTPILKDTTVTLDRKSYHVIGVMPREFSFPVHTDQSPQLWVPMGFTPQELHVGGSSFAFGALARLRPGISLGQAQSDVERVTTHIAAMFPAAQRGDLQIFGAVVPLTEEVVGEYRRPLLVLFLAVVFVLLIAIVNVANLLLAHGTGRQRELAIRIALGADDTRVLAQLLVESILLAILGGVVGFALAVMATHSLIALVPSHIPRLQTATVDAPVLIFTLAISIISALAFGTAPALLALRTDVHHNLKEAARGTTMSRSRQRLRASFVVAQVALALMLLAGAGLLLRSFERVLEVNPGFRPENVITASVSLSPTQYSTPSQVESFFKQLDDRLAHIPGAKSAGLSTDLPLETKFESALTVAGYQPPPGGSGLNAFSFVIGDYFQAMGIPLIGGRLFTPEDDENGQKVVIINQALAERFFAGREPIGGRLKLGTPGGTSPWWTVVGIAGNVKPFGLDEETLPHTYMPYVQHLPDQLKGGTAQNLILAVRTLGDPTSAAGAIRSAVWSLDAQVPVTDMRTMQQVISESTAPRRFNMALVGFFAATALLLAAVGLYGLMSYSVSQRRHEIGVRMTLGAGRRDVLGMILGSGFRLVGIGMVAGLVGTLATSRLLATFLFDIRPSDPLTFAAVAVLLAVTALAASLIPAFRATRVDPLITLRSE